MIQNAEFKFFEIDIDFEKRSMIRFSNDDVRDDCSLCGSFATRSYCSRRRYPTSRALRQKIVVLHVLPSRALVTASSGTLSSVNFATERLMGKPCAIEKDAQADVAAGSAAKINAVIFILDSYWNFRL